MGNEWITGSRVLSLPPCQDHISSWTLYSVLFLHMKRGNTKEGQSNCVEERTCAEIRTVEPGHQMNAFELWCWRRLLRILWTARKSNQSILKEINPEYSMEGLMLKLKLQYRLMWRTDSLIKTLMLGKIEGGKTRGWQRIRWLDGITDSKDMSLRGLREMLKVKDREAWRAAVRGVAKSQSHDLVTEQQQQWKGT